MKRAFAAVAAALVLTTGTALAFTATIALAQSYPGDPGVGVQRGMEQLNNSGQVGTATLYNAGAGTRVVVELHGTAPGRTQSVRIYRGPSCDDVGTSGPAYFLSDMRNGRSSSVVKAPESTLLSGNYNVVVFSSAQAGARATACGHLYAS
ncbi:MAG TPA: hypothetical protein VHT53_08920 [Candidatus Elarobacter sp.]|nr:hypothetical protein [Candidatus Elarobacter sp.]